MSDKYEECWNLANTEGIGLISSNFIGDKFYDIPLGDQEDFIALIDKIRLKFNDPMPSAPTVQPARPRKSK